MSLRDELLATLTKLDVRHYTFAGQAVFIKHWTEAEKIAWFAIVNEIKSSGNENLVRVKAVIYALCDESGNLIFTADDEPELLKAPATEIAAAFDAIFSVNGETNTDAKKN